jgi:hypothetical protein
VVLSPGVAYSSVVNYRCSTVYPTTAVSDITAFSQAIDFITDFSVVLFHQISCWLPKKPHENAETSNAFAPTLPT